MKSNSNLRLPSASLYLPVVLLLNGITSALAQGNYNAFVGCANPIGLMQSTAASNQLVCDNYCADEGWNYAAFQQNLNCYCSMEGPRPAGVSNGGEFGSANPCQYASFHKVSTSFEFEGCSTSSFGEGTKTQVFPSDQNGIPDFQSCFDYCKYSRSLSITEIFSPSSLACTCGPSSFAYDPDADVVCGSTGPAGGRSFFYSHDAAAATGGLTRRRRSLPVGLCPGGLTACAIPGSDTGFECIDTATELESCGGCLHGERGLLQGTITPINGTMGTDCSLLPGVRPGGVTCQSSKCETYACLPGHKMVGRHCVKT